VLDKRPLKIYLFCCATSYDQTEVVRGINQAGIEIKTVSLPCSGKLDILYLTKVFDTGADGAAVMMCKTGECRYLEGNLRAKKRAAAVEALLEESGLGKGRITVVQMGDGGTEQAIREINAFCLEIKHRIFVHEENRE